MQRSVAAGQLVTLDRVDCIIDGLRVKRVGEMTFEIVSGTSTRSSRCRTSEIFDAVVWMMEHAASWWSRAPRPRRSPRCCTASSRRRRDARSSCVLSGGNVNLDQLRGLKWN